MSAQPDGLGIRTESYLAATTIAAAAPAAATVAETVISPVEIGGAAEAAPKAAKGDKIEVSLPGGQMMTFICDAGQETIAQVKERAAKQMGLAVDELMVTTYNTTEKAKHKIDDYTTIAKAESNSLSMKRSKSAMLEAEKPKAEPMTEQKKSCEECAEMHGTDLVKGLSPAEAAQRLADHGPNRLTPPPVTPWWHLLIGEMIGGFANLLWVAAFLCILAYIIQIVQYKSAGIPASKVPIDNIALGCVLIFVVVASGIFAYFQVKSSGDVMASFASMIPESTKVIRGGETLVVNPEQLVVGDIIEFNVGDKVPADVRVVASKDFEVENASLTGESMPQKRNKDANPDEDEAFEATNLAFFTTSCVNGSCTGLVVRTGDDTVIGQIKKSVTEGDVQPSPISLEIHHFIILITTVAVGLGVSFFLIGILIGLSLIDSVVFLIAIIVANVPEGLLVTVTVCLTLTAKAMLKDAVLVKQLESVETLGSTSCICSDKTGTLTQNKMTVVHIFTNLKVSKVSTQITPGLVDGANEVVFDPSDYAFKQLWRNGLLNNDADYQFDNLCTHPTDKDKPRIANADAVSTPSVPYQERTETKGTNATDFGILKFADKVAVESDGIDSATGEPQAGHSVEEKFALIQAKVAAGTCPRAAPKEDTKKYGHSLLNPARSGWAEKRNNAEPGAVSSVEGSFPKPAAGYSLSHEYRARYPCAEGGALPFNSTAKIAAKIFPAEEGAPDGCAYTLLVKGAPEKIVARSTRCLVNGEIVEKTPAMNEEIMEGNFKLGSQGERVIGFGMEYLDVNRFPQGHVFTDEDFEFLLDKAEQRTELIFVGFTALLDPPRQTVPKAVADCQSADIQVVMVTGDHAVTAKAISRTIGIIKGKTGDDLALEEGKIGFKNPETGLKVTFEDLPEDVQWAYHDRADAQVVPGPQIKHIFDTMGDAGIDRVIRHKEVVFARCKPEQKLAIVQAFQRNGKCVAVTGDGVNDAPALSKADIGVAMGIAGSGVSKEAAKMILLDDNFASIVKGVKQGRIVFDNLKKSIAYTLTSNIPEISPFLFYIVFGCPLPLSTIMILAIDLGTDMYPAISMAYEEAENDIMKRPPRDKNVDKLVTLKLLSYTYLQIGIIQAAAGFFCFFTVLADCGFKTSMLFGLRSSWDDDNNEALMDSYGQEWTYKSRFAVLNSGQTSYFVSIVIVQWADLLICKTRIQSLFTQGMRNMVMNKAIVFETCLALFLTYCPGIYSFLQTRPLAARWWLPACTFSILIFIYDELRKLQIRKYRNAAEARNAAKGIGHRSDPGWEDPQAGWFEQITYY